VLELVATSHQHRSLSGLWFYWKKIVTISTAPIAQKSELMTALRLVSINRTRYSQQPKTNINGATSQLNLAL